MRVLVCVKANKATEAGQMPTTEQLTKMGQFNEELVKAGIMLAGEGLHPTSKAKRVKYTAKGPSIVDGPFAETKESDRRLLDVAGPLDGRSRRMAEALPHGRR